jgi:hypothetical protein
MAKKVYLMAVLVMSLIALMKAVALKVDPCGTPLSWICTGKSPGLKQTHTR